VKVLIKNLAIFFLCPSKQFLPTSFQIQLLEYFPQKQKELRQKQLMFPFLSVRFEFIAIFSYCLPFATVLYSKFVCLLCDLSPLFSSPPSPHPRTVSKDSLTLSQTRNFRTLYGARNRVGIDSWAPLKV
jgi:hypothetical protein